MNKDGEMVSIEDDEDDQFLLEEVYKSPPYTNKRIYFPDGHAVPK